MDRDQRWERTRLCYELLVEGKGMQTENITESISNSYNQGITDEFLEPHQIVENSKPIGTINDDDLIVNNDDALPVLTEGEVLKCIEITSEQKFTEPPRRYTEASLIRDLEKAGIGRPSTYATIVKTIQDRGYAVKDKGRFTPTK